MSDRPTYDELEQRIKELEEEAAKRNRAEETLRESEERYRLLFENESDAVMIFDAETLLFEDANRATLNQYGYPKEAFLTLTVEDIPYR